jgi:hypothetical protein
MPPDALDSGHPAPAAEPKENPPTPTQKTESETGQEARQEESPQEWTPDAIPEKDRPSFHRWRDKHDQEFLRKQSNRTGNALQRLRPETRERLLAEPESIDREREELAALRRIVADGRNNVGSYDGNDSSGRRQEPDDLETDAKSVLAELGWKPGDEGYDLLLRNQKATLKTAEERILRKIEKRLNPESITRQAAAKVKEESIQEQIQAVMSGPEWNDPDKGEEFQIDFKGRVQHYANSSRKVTVAQIAQESRDRVYGAAQKNAARAPRPAPGDTSSGKAPPPVSPDPLEAFFKEAHAKGLKDWT